MNKEAIHHLPKSNYCYAYNQKDIRVMLRTAKGDVSRVEVYYGDTYAWHRSRSIEAVLSFSDDLYDYFTASIFHESNRLSYYFRVFDLNGHSYNVCEDGILEDHELSLAGSSNGTLFTFCYPYVSEADIHVVPGWVKDSVFYQIFPDSFRNAGLGYVGGEHELWEHRPLETNSVKGGNLRGIIEKLDYIHGIGADCLYMTPIFKSESNHKYDTDDYYEIDPSFGTKEDLRQLVVEAHNRGMRVVLDAVFNHCGRHFPPFVDVEKNGASSAYYDWFHIFRHPFDTDELIRKEKAILEERGSWRDIDIDPETGRSWLPYRSFGFTPNMPKLNTANTHVKEYLLDVAEYWIKEFDIDGWRLDVANEVDHQFWRDFRRRVKSVKPECYIVGEIWRKAAPWLQGDQMDSMMNYPLMLALVDYFARRRINEEGFRNSVSSILVYNSWQVNETMMNLLESHDTERFLNIAKSKSRLLSAFGFIFAFPGAPYIYYGAEIGLSGGPDPDNRRHMIWNEKKWDRTILDFLKRLIRVRKSSKPLRRGVFKWINLDPRVLVFERSHEGENVLVLINGSTEEITLALPPEYKNPMELITENHISHEITLEPDQVAYIRSGTNELPVTGGDGKKIKVPADLQNKTILIEG